MHELSIASNIVDIATEETEKANAKDVSELELEIGTQSGVVMEALKFAMESAKKNSVIENAEIIYTEIEAKAKCTSCGELFSPDDIFSPCPKCGSFENEIIEGKELKVSRLIVS